jgi:hypothetical protein
VNRHSWQFLATVAALTAVAGCAYQEHYRIPALDSPSTRPSAPYPFYGYHDPGYYGYGSWYYGPRYYGHADPFDRYSDQWFGSYPYIVRRPPATTPDVGPPKAQPPAVRPPPAVQPERAPRERVERPRRAGSPGNREPINAVEP